MPWDRMPNRVRAMQFASATTVLDRVSAIVVACGHHWETAYRSRFLGALGFSDSFRNCRLRDSSFRRADVSSSFSQSSRGTCWPLPEHYESSENRQFRLIRRLIHVTKQQRLRAMPQGRPGVCLCLPIKRAPKSWHTAPTEVGAKMTSLNIGIFVSRVIAFNGTRAT